MLGLDLLILYLPGGLLLLFIASKNYILGKLSNDWPKTEGKIIRSGSGFIDTDTMQKEYFLNIQYHYSVEGKDFTSCRISFKYLSRRTKEAIQEILNRYPLGKKIDVYYNPRRPQMAILEPGTSIKSFIHIMLGVFFIAIGTIPIFIRISSN